MWDTILLGLALLIVFAFVFGRSSKTAQAAPKKKVEEPPKKKKAPLEIKPRTRAEVAKHNTREDCWLIIDGKVETFSFPSTDTIKVYDVTDYVDDHFGGDAILNNAGGDSSKGFHGGNTSLIYHFFKVDL